jgi:ribonuclease P protein component
MFEFPKLEHLRRPREFERVYERRRSVSDAWLIVYGCENGLAHPRVGFSVGRWVGNAVRRNRLRRLYREAFRLTRPAFSGGVDLVLVPRTSKTPSLEDLKESLPRLVAAVIQKLAPQKKRS